MQRRRLALVAPLVGPLVALVTAATPASAQQPADTARAGDAERLFREGRTLMEAGDLGAACPKFAESERLDPAPGTLLSLADCEERNKKLTRAREHYQLAASGFPKRDPRRAFATGRAQALEKRLARLTLRLPPDAPADAAIRMGDAPVPRSELGAAMSVDPGEVRIVVNAPGHAEKVIASRLAEGETREILCELGPAESAVPAMVPPSSMPAWSGTAEGPPPKPRSDARRTVSFVLLGVGAASLVVGGVSGLMAAGKASTVKDHCTGDYVCDQTGVDAASSGRFLSPLSTVTFIAGAALVGAGAYLYFTSAKNKKSTSAAAVAVVPLVSTDGAGLRLWREF
jgi:hypothetical protein